MASPSPNGETETICRCICHEGFGGAHPNAKCPCKGGPENEWTANTTDAAELIRELVMDWVPEEVKAGDPACFCSAHRAMRWLDALAVDRG